MGRRRDIDSLRLSERSNRLALGNHHIFSASPVSPSFMSKKRMPTTSNTSVLVQIDANGSARPRSITNAPVSKETKTEVVAIRQKIRSLIPPDVPPKRTRTDPNVGLVLRHRRRFSTSSCVSTKSLTPSVQSRKRLRGPKPTLATMPAEIQNLIFRDLCQEDWHSLMLANSNLSEVAASYMYIFPKYASTYRYAQFAHTVSHKKHYADMVKTLDVSSFGETPESDRDARAGWREWKYRNTDWAEAAAKPPIPAPKQDKKSRKQPRKPKSTTHPPPSPYLRLWNHSRDIPIGGLCHVIQACQNLITVNISRLQIGVDFIVCHEEHPVTTWTKMIYVSDIAKSHKWKGNELQPIYNIYIIDQLRKLPHLERVIANNLVSMSTLMAQELVDYCPSLSYVDFTNSGMEKSKPWAVKGTRDQVVTIIRKMEQTVPRSPDPRRASLH